MDDATRPLWLTAFLDFPASEFDTGAAFWARATGWPRSPSRGALDEFTSLVPPDGADYLRLQRLGTGETRVHLDVHVADPEEAAFAAQERGASVVRQVGPRLVVMTSPAGFEFCLVAQQRDTVPAATRWPDGHRSRVAQLCLDIPAEGHATELGFWAATLGGTVSGSQRPELAWIDPAGTFPFRVVTQRLALAQRMRAHLDIATDDLAAEVARLREAGAVVRAVRPERTVLEAPGGTSVCVLDRDPDAVPDAGRR